MLKLAQLRFDANTNSSRPVSIRCLINKNLDLSSRRVCWFFFELNRLNPNWVAKKDYEQDSTSNRCNTDFELIRLNPTCEKRKLEWNRLLLIYLHSYLDRLNPNVVKWSGPSHKSTCSNIETLDSLGKWGASILQYSFWLTTLKTKKWVSTHRISTPTDQVSPKHTHSQWVVQDWNELFFSTSILKHLRIKKQRVMKVRQFKTERNAFNYTTYSTLKNCDACLVYVILELPTHVHASHAFVPAAVSCPSV